MMNICFICDNNYVFLTKTAINSFVHTQTEDLKIYIIGVELSDENVKQFDRFSAPNVTINVIRQNNPYTTINKKHPYITKASLMKFQIANLVNEDKVLYVDGDVIATDSITDFYNTDISAYYAAVIRDLVAEIEHQDNQRLNRQFYFNSGVMILNLKKIREDNLVEKLSDYVIHDKELKYMDQDTFNVVFADKVVYTDLKWNYFNMYTFKT